jgi:hypothetical protein
MEFGFLTDSMKFRSFFILIILLLLLIVGYRSYTSTNLNGPPNSGSDKDDTKPSNSPPTVTYWNQTRQAEKHPSIPNSGMVAMTLRIK